MNPKPEWPRLLYHKQMAPGGWRIESQDERDQLGPGWTEAPEPPKLQKLDSPPAEAQKVAPPQPPQPDQTQDAPAAGPSTKRRRGRKPKIQGGVEA